MPAEMNLPMIVRKFLYIQKTTGICVVDCFCFRLIEYWYINSKFGPNYLDRSQFMITGNLTCTCTSLHVKNSLQGSIYLSIYLCIQMQISTPYSSILGSYFFLRQRNIGGPWWCTTCSSWMGASLGRFLGLLTDSRLSPLQGNMATFGCIARDQSLCRLVIRSLWCCKLYSSVRNSNTAWAMCWP